MSDATPDIRGLDVAAVEAWLHGTLAELHGPLTFSLIAGGHSNLTYAVHDARGAALVLRRGPLSARSSTAHDMSREFRVLDALAPTDVPVPVPRALCEDLTVNGQPFYVMEMVEGTIVDNPGMADRALPTTELRRTASEQIVDVLADLHRIDIDAVGLGAAGRRESFLERQLARMSGVWEQTKTRELPLVDALHARLLAAAPPQRHTGIVHSDFRFGNVLLDGSGHLTAVLDWELWALGDVLSDVGFLLNNWYEPDNTDPQIWMEVPPTMAPGFLSRAEVAARYATRTGFDLTEIEYYRSFQYWKVAILAEGVKRRYDTGAMGSGDVDFAHLNQRVIDLATLADAHLELVELG